MADLRYSVDIDTKSAERSLQGLASQIQGFGTAIAGAFAFKEVTNLTATFEGLRTSLKILYKSGTEGAAVFQDIQKLAATTVFSVSDLTQTVIKLKAAGLNPTIEQLRLFGDVSSVAADSVGALQAITDLYARTTAGGLGLEDLNRLADRGIPVFAILQEQLGLSRLEITKIGQSAEGAQIILKALEVGLQETFGGASAKRMGGLTQSISNMKDAWGQFLDTLGQAGFNQGLGALAKGFGDILIGLRPLAAAIGYVLGGAFTLLGENIKIVTALAAGFFTAFAVGRIVAVVAAVRSITLALRAMAVTSAFATGGLSAVLGAAAALGVYALTSSDAMDELNGKLDEMAGKGLDQGQIGADADNLKGKLAGLNEGLRSFRAEMDGAIQQFKSYNDAIINNINLDAAMLGQTKLATDLEKNRAEMMKRSQDEINKLIEAKAKLTNEQIKEGRGAVIDEQIAKIKEITAVDIERTSIALKNASLRQQAEQLRLYGIQQEYDMQDKLRSIQDDIAKTGMSEIEKKYYDIATAADASARSAIRAEEARLGRPLDANEAQKYYDVSKRGMGELIDLTRRQYEGSRTFSAGWTKAFNQYADDATNAARTAERMFSKFTQGMEDLIVNFVKTGKFEWRDFVNTMAEELLRAQIQRTIANIMGGFSMGGGKTQTGGTSGGGLFDSIKNLFGGLFANGGTLGAGKWGIAGEAGPEVIMGPANIVPAGQLAGAGGVTNVVYNINAVDALSFQQLVARDPQFIHAVAMQGARSAPSTRR